jgi:hypothetical protein
MNRSREPAPVALGTSAALTYPNDRLCFFGQMVSLFGTRMQVTALGYLVIALVGVMSFFGMSFATLIPAWAVEILGGDARTNG